jgi:hypothetical protein
VEADMFAEYSYSLDADKAKIKLNTKAGQKDIEKDQIYLDIEETGFVAHIKMKSKKKTYDEQKWFLQCREKGVVARRLWTKGYLLDVLITGIMGLAAITCIVFSFVLLDIRLEMILFGMAFILVMLFYAWKRVFTPIVALKIFLIKQL